MKKKISVLIIIMAFIMGIGISVNATEINYDSEYLSCYQENPLYANENITKTKSKLRTSVSATTKNAVALQEYEQNSNNISKDVRDYMVKRTQSFTIYSKMTLSEEINNDIFKEYIDNIIKNAMSEELANSSSAGDYLKWSWGNYGVSASSIRYKVENDTYTYYLDLVFNFNYYTTYNQEEKLDSDIKTYINNNIDINNDSNYEKICIIYDFIASNVRYDYTNLDNSSYMLKYTAYAAMENKTAVCQGYAALFYKMIKETGVEDVRMITSSTHAWNIVKLNDKYYNLDATWDEGKTVYYYFLKGSDNFKESDHTRSAEYCSDEFNSLYPTSTTNYNNKNTYISMNKCSIGSTVQNYTYTGSKITPPISDIKCENTTLTDSKDYLVKYMNNINAGTAVIKVIGKENYVGQITKTFKINPKNMSQYTVSLSSTIYTFDGKYKEPKVSVNGLTLNKDYSVKYSNNYYSGNATASIVGKGNYTGSISKAFYINPAKISGFKLSKSYTNKVQLKWNKQAGVTSYRIYKYNTKTKKYDYIKSAGSTTCYITGLSAGNTYCFRIRATKKTSSGTLYGAYTYVDVATLPNKVTFSSVKSGSKKMTVKWKKVSACTGYEIQYSTSSKFTSSKTKKLTINNKKTVSKTIKGLKRRQKYYVRVRAYTMVNGKKYYGSYSKVKIVRVR